MCVTNVTKINLYYFYKLFFPSIDHVKFIITLHFAGFFLIFSSSENLIF